MSALSSTIIEEFYKLCRWTYVSYSIRKYFFDNNPNKECLENPRYSLFFEKLREIIQEHWLLQLAKLHDPAVQNGNINLTINYIIEYGGWDSATATELTRLRNEMTALAKPAKIVRNKMLSHNDLIAILAGGTLGEFKEGDDLKYFENLKNFSNLICEKTTGYRTFDFDDFAQSDIAAFMKCFKAGSGLIDA